MKILALLFLVAIALRTGSSHCLMEEDSAPTGIPDDFYFDRRGMDGKDTRHRGKAAVREMLKDMKYFVKIVHDELYFIKKRGDTDSETYYRGVFERDLGILKKYLRMVMSQKETDVYVREFFDTLKLNHQINEKKAELEAMQRVLSDREDEKLKG